MSKHAHQLGLLYLLVTAVGWGLNWPAMKFLLLEWPPLFSRGLAGLAAAALLMLLLQLRGEALRPPRGLWPRLVLAGSINVFAWMGFSTLSMQWLPATVGALLVYTMPAWAVLFAWLLRGQRPGWSSIAGLASSFAGVSLLLAPGLGPGGLAGPGVFFALLAAVCFALGTVIQRPLEMPPLAALAWQLIIGCLPMLAWGLLVEQPRLTALSGVGVGVMAYMTLIPMCVCYLAWFSALRRVPPALASISTLLTPVVGVLSSALVLQEAFGWRQALALALTLAGIALTLRRA